MEALLLQLQGAVHLTSGKAAHPVGCFSPALQAGLVSQSGMPDRIPRQGVGFTREVKYPRRECRCS